ncbi:MAG TPA: glycosyltransferase family 4 protein [Actinomycetota bacterium]|nr:glycosyltransferase family 4 protein [Actinomycetota bacterium]
MRIVLWHGYLLTGSGSNVFTANVARAWREAGHDVVLMCQETLAGVLEYVDSEADMSADNKTFVEYPTKASPAAGRCRVVRPAIGEVLPVYVYDEYEGFTAKRFVDLTDEELDDYVWRNVEALTTVIREHEPDAIVVGHEVMGPFVARLACEATNASYVVKLHGSALEFAVKEQDRYRHYAHEGLTGAAAVVGGSHYMIAAASAVVPGWEARATVVNPGCDVGLFRPAERAPDGGPVAGYVGKLIPGKGVHHFLAALGATHAGGLQAVVVGYGSFERELKALAYATETKNAGAARKVAREAGLDELLRFFESAPDAYWDRAAAVPVEFAGRLEHGPLADVLPGWDVLVVPSQIPEAFGMVAAEAAASGVLPVVPRHSGIGEAGATIERALDVPGLLTFDPDDPVNGIAERVDAILSLPYAERRELELAASDLARREWSWDTVAARLLEVATR